MSNHRSTRARKTIRLEDIASEAVVMSSTQMQSSVKSGISFAEKAATNMGQSSHFDLSPRAEIAKQMNLWGDGSQNNDKKEAWPALPTLVSDSDGKITKGNEIQKPAIPHFTKPLKLAMPLKKTSKGKAAQKKTDGKDAAFENINSKNVSRKDTNIMATVPKDVAMKETIPGNIAAMDVTDKEDNTPICIMPKTMVPKVGHLKPDLPVFGFFHGTHSDLDHMMADAAKAVHCNNKGKSSCEVVDKGTVVPDSISKGVLSTENIHTNPSINNPAGKASASGNAHKDTSVKDKAAQNTLPKTPASKEMPLNDATHDTKAAISKEYPRDIPLKINPRVNISSDAASQKTTAKETPTKKGRNKNRKNKKSRHKKNTHDDSDQAILTGKAGEPPRAFSYYKNVRLAPIPLVPLPPLVHAPVPSADAPTASTVSAVPTVCTTPAALVAPSFPVVSPGTPSGLRATALSFVPAPPGTSIYTAPSGTSGSRLSSSSPSPSTTPIIYATPRFPAPARSASLPPSFPDSPAGTFDSPARPSSCSP